MKRARCLLLVVLLAWQLPLAADPLLFRVEGEHGNAWLLGSVHTLRPSDYPLDERIEHAYAAAGHLVFEIAPQDFTGPTAAITALELARFADGRQLADVVDDETLQELAALLRKYGTDAAQMNGYEPWFVAMQLMNFTLLHHGYSPLHGVDLHFMTRAQKDGKRTSGLETVREQLGIFDALPMERQLALLEQTIAESGNAGPELARLMRAWLDGDENTLAQIADEEMQADPLLREALLVKRNRRWAAEIGRMLATEKGDVMLVVGALHLAGEDGLVTLLREAGYEVRKVSGEEAPRK